MTLGAGLTFVVIYMLSSGITYRNTWELVIILIVMGFLLLLGIMAMKSAIWWDKHIASEARRQQQYDERQRQEDERLGVEGLKRKARREDIATIAIFYLLGVGTLILTLVWHYDPKSTIAMLVVALFFLWEGSQPLLHHLATKRGWAKLAKRTESPTHARIRGLSQTTRQRQPRR